MSPLDPPLPPQTAAAPSDRTEARACIPCAALLACILEWRKWLHTPGHMGVSEGEGHAVAYPLPTPLQPHTLPGGTPEPGAGGMQCFFCTFLHLKEAGLFCIFCVFFAFFFASVLPSVSFYSGNPWTNLCHTHHFGCPGDGLLPMPLTRCIQMHTPSPCWVCRLQH